MFATTYRDKIKLYNSGSFEFIREINEFSDSFKFTPNGDFIVSSDGYNSIKIFNVETSEILTDSPVISLAVNSTKIAVGLFNKFNIYEFETGELITSVNSQSNFYRVCCVDFKDDLLLVKLKNNNSATLIDTNTNEIIHVFDYEDDLQNYENEIISLYFFK